MENPEIEDVEKYYHLIMSKKVKFSNLFLLKLLSIFDLSESYS